MKVLALRNGLWNVLANLAGALAGLVGSVLIVRSLAAEEYGTFSYYVWLAGVVGVLGTLAFPGALTKITSELIGGQEQDQAHALARLIWRGLLGLNLLLGAAMLLVALNAPDPQRIYLTIIAACIVPNALAGVGRSTLWGRERYRPVSLIAVMAAAVQLVLIAVVVAAGWGAPGFVAAVLATNSAHAVGLAWVLARGQRAADTPAPMRQPSRATLRRYVAFLVPATLSQFFVMIVWERSEVFFLARLANFEQVGLYSLAYTSYAMFLTLGWALVNGFHPAISRDFGAGAWDHIRQQVRMGSLLAACFAVPLSFGAWATFDALLPLLYGDKVREAVPVALVLFLGLLPGVCGAVLGMTVSAVGGVWLHVRLGLVLSALNIGLDLALIPMLGARGAAVANTSAQVVFFVLLVVAMQRRYRIGPDWRVLGGIVGVGAITTFLLPRLVRLWLPGEWGVAGAIVVAAGAYVLTLWRLGYLRPLREEDARSDPPVQQITDWPLESRDWDVGTTPSSRISMNEVYHDRKLPHKRTRAARVSLRAGRGNGAAGRWNRDRAWGRAARPVPRPRARRRASPAPTTHD
jgi:O-antigen/teichoic acid export membrane protein